MKNAFTVGLKGHVLPRQISKRHADAMFTVNATWRGNSTGPEVVVFELTGCRCKLTREIFVAGRSGELYFLGYNALVIQRGNKGLRPSDVDAYIHSFSVAYPLFFAFTYEVKNCIIQYNVASEFDLLMIGLLYAKYYEGGMIVHVEKYGYYG